MCNCVGLFIINLYIIKLHIRMEFWSHGGPQPCTHTTHKHTLHTQHTHTHTQHTYTHNTHTHTYTRNTHTQHTSHIHTQHTTHIHTQHTYTQIHTQHTVTHTTCKHTQHTNTHNTHSHIHTTRKRNQFIEIRGQVRELIVKKDAQYHVPPACDFIRLMPCIPLYSNIKYILWSYGIHISKVRLY